MTIEQQIKRYSDAGLTSKVVAKILKMPVEDIRRIKLSIYNPKRYQELEGLELSKKREEESDRKAFQRHPAKPEPMTDEEKELCELAKAWKPVDLFL